MASAPPAWPLERRTPDASALREFGPGLRYALRLPPDQGIDTPVFVAIHGISRNALDHFNAFAGLAQSRQAIVIAPLFDAAGFPDYQRLGRRGLGPRADLALIALVDDVLASCGLRSRKLHLFGHSGGAQFTHRFVIAHPQRVARYAISAAGWYTFPDESADYPYGLREPPDGLDMTGQQRFLSVPGCVFVGMRDQRRGPSLRQRERVDTQQGTTRIERAMRWTAAMNSRARELGLPEPVQLRRLPDAGHSFSGLVRRAGLHEQAWEFLLGRGRCRPGSIAA